jgi:hypothetical protein
MKSGLEFVAGLVEGACRSSGMRVFYHVALALRLTASSFLISLGMLLVGRSGFLRGWLLERLALGH